jgi:hypothetical protein
MNARLQTQTKVAPWPSFMPVQRRLLQRKRACSNHGSGGECEECSKKKRLGLQTKLKINEPGDIYEQEADRIADQVMSTPAHTNVSAPRIQRFSGQPNGGMDMAPATVEQALASPGRPLEPALRKDMEQRFAYDFSRVRVHSGAVAKQSARDVSAHAYTVGENIVFGAGRFAAGTHEGRRLIAHELTHVLQQSGTNGSRVGESDGRRGQPNLSTTSDLRVQRGPSDTKSPKADVPILGGSESTSEVETLYFYGDLEGRESFESTAGYPRLTEYGLGTSQAEASEFTGTPVRDKLRYRYELKIDKAYFKENFISATGTRGAYAEYGTKKKLKIPVNYFRKELTLTSSSTAPPARTVSPKPIGRTASGGGKGIAPVAPLAEGTHGEIITGKPTVVTASGGGKGTAPVAPLAEGTHGEIITGAMPATPAGGTPPGQPPAPGKTTTPGTGVSGESAAQDVLVGEAKTASKAGRFATRLAKVGKFGGPFLDAFLMLLNYRDVGIDESAFAKLMEEKLQPIVDKELSARSAEIARVGADIEGFYGVYGNVNCELHYKVVPDAKGQSQGKLQLYDARFLGLNISGHNVSKAEWDKEASRKANEGIQQATVSILVYVPPHPRLMFPEQPEPTDPLYFSSSGQRSALGPQPVTTDELLRWARRNYPRLFDDPRLAQNFLSSNEFVGSRQAREKALNDLRRRIQEEKMF